jgi:hypothetical protein
MIYFTQLIYINEGEENTFDEFESIPIPLIGKYNGQLLFRLRPSQNDFIEISLEKPYEIHFGSFKSEEDFENFMKDEERKKFLHLKEQSIRSSIIVKGSKL